MPREGTAGARMMHCNALWCDRRKAWRVALLGPTGAGLVAGLVHAALHLVVSTADTALLVSDGAHAAEPLRAKLRVVVTFALSLSRQNAAALETWMHSSNGSRRAIMGWLPAFHHRQSLAAVQPQRGVV